MIVPLGSQKTATKPGDEGVAQLGYTSWSTHEGAEEARPERSPMNGGHGGFDPYRAWLNVREVHRPLTAYQLLGLAALEDDLDKIRAAAKLQRVAMQTHRFEAAPEIWENVNAELEEAVRILLDPDQKMAYDLSLRLHEEEIDRSPQMPLGSTPGRSQGGTLLCPRCRTPAPATRRFCGNCGTPLWEPCFRCGTLAMAGEKFCGACGANLLTGVDEQVQVLEAKLREADQLRAECRYEESVSVLAAITKMEHSRLQPYIQRAHETLQAISADRQHGRELAEKTYQEAQQLAAEGDYEGAVAMLESVPVPLRTEGSAHLLDEMRMRLEQIAELDQEIREAVSANRVSDVLQLVDQLLTLRPDHANALKLAGKFRDHLIKLSGAKLTQRQYEAAVKLLDQVPPSVRNEAWELAHQEASELVWLTWDLRNAPVVDTTLVAFAERLVQRVPGDAKLKTAWDELRRRVARGPKDMRQLTVPWAAAPQEPYLGCPVDWLTGFQRISVKAELDQTPLREHPGCFFVAAGLALQGLGKTATKLNLLPGDRGVLGSVSQLWRMRPTRTAWGIDLSPSGLKAVKLSLDAQQQVVLEACDFIEHKKLLSQTVNEEEEKTLIEETVQTFLSRNNIKGCRICLGLPSRMVLIRQLKMPSLQEAKMASALKLEAKRLVPLPLEEIVWGHEMLEHVNGEALKEVDIALVAVKRLLLKDRLAKLEALGLPVDIVQSDCLALHGFFAFEFGSEEAPSGLVSSDDINAVTAVVDMGSESTNILMVSPRLAWIHTSGWGAHNLTKALVREFRSTVAQAEQLQRNPITADALDPVLTTMNAVFEDLAKEIQAAMALFNKAHRHKHVERVYGIGGGFQTHGLLRYLRLGR